MSDLTKLGLVLLVVFPVSLMALAAELICLLCCRRRPRREPSGADDPELAVGNPRESPTSKQLLLYFFCRKRNRCRVEPASAATPVCLLATAGPEGTKASPSPAAAAAVKAELEVEVELARWQMMHASRVLFTIKEDDEEKEAGESGGWRRSSGGGQAVAGWLPAVWEEHTDEREAESDSELTPFSTPFASLPFHTPSPSPTRGSEGAGDAAFPADTGGAADDGVSTSPEKKQPRWGEAS